MQRRYDNIIAIDPDVDKSGLAVLKTSTKEMQLSVLSFPMLLDFFQAFKETQREKKESFIVIVEAGRKISKHWHVKGRDSASLAAAKGNSVGRNHEVGAKIVEMCQHYGIEVMEQVPLRKYWKGKDGKITHDEFVLIIRTKKRTNQEMRDAGLIAWHQAGFPIRMQSRSISK